MGRYTSGEWRVRWAAQVARRGRSVIRRVTQVAAGTVFARLAGSSWICESRSLQAGRELEGPDYSIPTERTSTEAAFVAGGQVAETVVLAAELAAVAAQSPLVPTARLGGGEHSSDHA
jgi:hypothetical protein